MSKIYYVLNCGHKMPAYSADASQRKSPGEQHPCSHKSCKNVFTVIKSITIVQ